MGDFLCIGDYICLFCEETEGYIYSWQSSSTHNGLYIFQGQDRKRPERVPNPHAIIFQVCIQNRYKLNKNCRKCVSACDKDSENVELKAQLSQARAAARAEDQDNVAEQKRQHGKKVRYGEIIQLKHLFTGKFVHISTTQTSQRDKNNMLVSLHPFNGKTAQFRILPRYKVKSEGEYVQYFDQIILESYKSPGHYFHSSVPWNISGHHIASELNLGVAMTGFTIVKNTRVPKDEDIQATLRGGSIVRMFHKDLEAFLAAEGLFEDEITEDVHLRVREINFARPKSMSPPTTAINYWQIEAEESILNGDVIRWEQQVRLRHMVTRQYLCVKSDFTLKSGQLEENLNTDLSVSLTPDQDDPRTVFRLHPVLNESGPIQFGSYARIEHVLTGYWFHGLKDVEYERSGTRGDSGEVKSFDTLKWDGAPLRKLTFTEDKRYVDVFTIQDVEQTSIQDFNYVAGMVPFIFTLISDRDEGRYLNAIKTHTVEKALKELSDFLIVKGDPSKKRQKLLRNLRVVDQLVRLLKNQLDSAPDHHYLLNVYKGAYDVLQRYLMGNSRKNALYFAKYIDFFSTTQIRQKEGDIGLNVAHMLVELIRDNRKIVDRLQRHHIDEMVQLLKERKHYLFLELLSVMCVCNGIAIPDNQSYITEAWLRTDRVPVFGQQQPSSSNRPTGYGSGWQFSRNVTSGSSDVYLVERGQYIGREHNMAYISTDIGQSWVPLHDFVKKDGFDYEENKYLFLDRQLDLLGKLCAGKNAYAIRTITKDLDILTWEQAFFCLQSEMVPADLRAKYCSLIIDLFVNVGSNFSVLDQRQLVYVYEEVDDPRAEKLKQKKQISEDLVTVYPVVRDWIADFLVKNTEMCASTIGQNKLIEQVLRLLHYLVSFGYYADADEIAILLEPLLLLLDGRTDRPVPRQKHHDSKDVKKMIKLYNTADRFEQCPETKALIDAKHQGLGVLELLYTFQANTRLESFVVKFKRCERSSVMHLNSRKKRKKLSALNPLLDTSYDAQDSSKKHLGRQKKVRHELQDMFDASSYFNVDQLTAIALDLSNYKYDKMLTQCLAILNKLYSSKSDLFRLAKNAQVLTTQDSIKINSEVKRYIPILRQFTNLKINEEQAEIICKILDTFKGYCHQRFEDDLRHPVNQSVLINHGILDILFDMLSEEIDTGLTDEYSVIWQVWTKALQLLRYLTRDNPEVQDKVYERFDQLMEIKTVESELALALREAFQGNQNNCLKIQPYQVLKVVNMAAENQHSAPEVLDLLNSIVKVSGLDLALKRNQGLAMKYLMQNYHRAVYVFNMPMDERIALLTEKQPNPHLDYLIRVVDLLAVCAEGENRYIESLCQTILPIDEIITILNHPHIDNNLKKPFVRYLVWVYMRTAGTMVESGAGDLPHDKYIWRFMEGLVEQADDLRDYLRENEAKSLQVLRKAPGKSFVPDDGNAEHVAMSSAFYFIEAVFPFLQTFFNKFYWPDAAEYPDEASLVDKLALSLVLLGEALGPSLSNASHLKHIIACVPTVLSSSSLPKSDTVVFDRNKQHYRGSAVKALMENFIEKYGSGRNLKDPAQEAVQTYTVYYKDEVGLNSKFKSFAINSSLVYGGQNKVTAQLKFKSKREYVDVDGDEALPLGEEFQNHVKCFIRPEKDVAKRYQLASKLVQQLAISAAHSTPTEKVRQEREELDVKSLQILRAMIHNEERKLPENWQLKGNNRFVKKQVKLLADVQDTLNDHKAAIRVLEHLGRPSDNIVREVLAFMSMMLYNANRKVQQSMLDYFTGTKEESFFYAIRCRFQLSAVSIKERRALAAQHEARLKEAATQAKSFQNASTVGRKAMEAHHSLSLRSVQTGSRPTSRRSLLTPQQSFDEAGKHVNESKMSLLSAPSPPEKSQHQTLIQKLSNGGIHDMYTAIDNKAKEHELMEIKVEGANNLRPTVGVGDEEDDVLTGLEYKDEGNICLVLRVLAAMCDGQNSSIQNYLRDQPDNIKTINIVAETCQFMSVLYSNISSSTIDLVIQIFETLNEFVSGNQPNRVVMLDNKIIDYMNFILRAGKYKDCPWDKQLELRKVISTLLHSLVEENGPEPQLVAKEVKDTIDRDALIRVMTECHQAIVPQSTKSVTNTKNIKGKAKNIAQAGAGLLKDMMDSSKTNELKDHLFDVGFGYYLTLARFNDIESPNYYTHELKLTVEQMQAYKYFQKYSLSVEVMKDGYLQKVHFRVTNKNVLREEVKEKLKWEVDRSSPSNKIRDLMQWSKDILKDIYFQRKILRNPLAVFFTKFWLVWNYACILLSLAINILMLISWEARHPTMMDIEKNASSPTVLPNSVADPWPVTSSVPGYQFWILGLGGAHNLFSLFVLISYFLSNHPRLPNFGWIRKLKRRFRNKENTVQELEDDDDDDDDDDDEDVSKLDINLFSFTTLYYLVFVAMSAAGTKAEGYFFAFHLINIVNNNQLLQGVIKAVTQNGLSLFWVGVLGVVIFYLYGLISFAFMRSAFLPISNQAYCDTLWQCTVTVMRYGLVGDIFDKLNVNVTQATFFLFALYAIFHISFFIFITTIGLNVIFGIIVDTFSELRDLKWTAESDMRDTCFICNRGSHDFEHHGLGFAHHVRHEHSMWSYIFFFIHLNDTKPNDYTALEFHVSNLVKREQHDFFPLNQALSVSGREEDLTDTKIDDVLHHVMELVKKQREEEYSRRRAEEKRKQKLWQDRYKSVVFEPADFPPPPPELQQPPQPSAHDRDTDEENMSMTSDSQTNTQL